MLYVLALDVPHTVSSHAALTKEGSSTQHIISCILSTKKKNVLKQAIDCSVTWVC